MRRLEDIALRRLEDIVLYTATLERGRISSQNENIMFDAPIATRITKRKYNVRRTYSHTRKGRRKRNESWESIEQIDSLPKRIKIIASTNNLA
jgi:hypothetical protein